MKIKISEITKKEIWEKFLLRQKAQPFFQSWNWGEVQEGLGNRVWRIGLYEGKRLVGTCLVINVRARRGRFLHLRHGPVLSKFTAIYFDPLIAYVQKLAREQEADFLRISPVIEDSPKMRELLKRRGFHPSPLHRMDAEDCWVLDLDKSEEELFSGMRKTTRYLVRKGEKDKAVKIEKGGNKKDIKEFINLYQKTAHKHGFLPHQGIAEEFESFKKEDHIELFLAKYLPAGRQGEKRTVAGALVVFYGNQAVYHHGASDPKYDRLSPSYLLQWEAIKEAKRRDKRVYNFWGVAPEDKPKHPWAGLTLFKKGFGGHPQSFLHSHDLPLTAKYWLTWLLETYRRITKGY